MTPEKTDNEVKNEGRKFMKVENLKIEKLTAISVPVIIVISAVLSVLSKDAATFQQMNSVLGCFPEAAATVTAGLLFPVLLLIICLAAGKSRVKLSAMLFVKIVLELLLMPFGINLNVPTEFFSGDFGFLFFVFTDIILLIMAQNGDIGRSVERAVAGAALTAVSVVLVFTVVMETEPDVIFRSVYVLWFYVLAYLLARDMDYITFDETDTRLFGSFSNELLLATASAAALCSFITSILIIACSKENITAEIFSLAEMVCCAAWSSLCFLSGSFAACVCREYTKVKGIIISVISATAATVIGFFVTGYINAVRIIFISGGTVDTDMGKAFVSYLREAKISDCLNILSIFAVTFAMTLMISAFVRKIISDGDIDESEYDDLDSEELEVFTDFHCKVSEAFSFVRNEGNIISFDFKNKTPVDSNGKPIFEGGSFTMDGKEYDILLTIDDEEENTKFIVYTDNSKEKNGKIRIFASKYNPLVDVGRLLPIESDEEWNVVERILDHSIAEIEKDEREEKRKKIRDGEIDSFVTLSYLANAIARDESNDTPFILTTKGDGDEKDMISVVMTGSTEERKNLVKYTMMSLIKSLRLGDLSAQEAYTELSSLVLETVWDVYKQETDEDEPLPFD